MSHHLLPLVGDSIAGKTVHLAAQFTATLWSHLAHLAAESPRPKRSNVQTMRITNLSNTRLVEWTSASSVR
jgi:hypothetical protein